MKRMFWILLFGAVLGGCGGPSHMLKKDELPTAASITPLPGKAALMVARTWWVGGAQDFETYLDRKMIGVTMGKTYFAKTDIEPGKKYVIVTSGRSFATSGTADTVQVDFEPNKAYFLHINIYTAGFGPRASLAPVSQATLDGWLQDSRYFVYDSAHPGEDLTEQEYADAIKDAAYKLKVKDNGDEEFLPLRQ